MGSNRTSVSIRWAGPHNDGGSQILGYEVELRPKNKLALEGISNEWLTVYQVTICKDPPWQQCPGVKLGRQW